ncbi:uncharacterized protein LOC122051121 [Zingiber officinale]|uniref:uncharacterized protein LOC122051121 n=1 Tax=Zingiber officinale TaxID=94328 RepID=UPI001C4C21BC|nr:uncharacterized protein LOC122051121 [Zingiber officinale]
MVSEGGGFFHLFDRNRKSRKKLFHYGGAYSEKTTKGNMCEDNKTNTQLHKIDQNQLGGQASTELGSKYYGNSASDQEESRFRTPGVVARLMGLDSIPASGNSKPDFTPLHDSHSLWGDNNQKKDAGYYSNDGQKRDAGCYPNDDIYHVITINNFYSGNTETKFQRMPSSPIEKFQIEMLPPRGAKTVSIAHHKLLSPVANPGFISPSSASYIIEAAAKILEPEFHRTTMGGVHSFRSPLKSLKDSESNGMIGISRNISTQIESSASTTKTGDSASLGGQILRKSSKSSKDNTGGLLNTSTDKSQALGAKGNSGSFPVKVKVNSLKEGASLKRSTILGNKNEKCSSNKPVNSLSDNQNSNWNKSVSSVNGCHVLKRRDQKHKYLLGKSKLTLQSSVTEQQGTKNVTRHMSSEKRKIGNEFPGNDKVGYKKGIGTTYSNKEGMPLGCQNFLQENILVYPKSSSQTSSSNEKSLVPPGKSGALVQHNFVLDEHLKCRYVNVQKNTDVVSFTFTSHIRKPKRTSLSSCNKVENQVKKNEYCDEKNQDVICSDNRILSHMKQNVTEDDCLGILLERKLKELNTGAQSPYFNLLKRGSVSACRSIMDDSGSAFNGSSAEHKRKTIFSSNKSVSLASDLAECNISFRLQEVSRGGSHRKVDENGHQDLSISSCHSIRSSSSFHGNKISSTLCPDLSDSVSQFTENSGGKFVPEISEGSHASSSSKELEYVNEIIINTGFMFEDLIPCPVDHSFEILDPILFDKLEETRTSTPNEAEEKRLRMRRKILFDSVNECLDRKCSQYFRAGFWSWSKGVLAVAAKNLGDELYKEISGWSSSVGDWLVDELVNGDMSSHLGAWAQYEIEAFEAGVEIESVLFNSLVEEVAAGFL